jgi:MYXO-CTERM domain-containing protein
VQIEFTFSRSADYFRAQLMPAAKEATSRQFGAALVTFVAGVGILGSFSDTTAGTAIGAVLTLAGAVLLLLTRRRRTALVAVPESWLAPRRWRLDDDELASSSGRATSAYGWVAIRPGLVRPEAYLLRHEDGSLIDVPREPLTAGQDAELRAFLTGRGLLTAEVAR